MPKHGKRLEELYKQVDRDRVYPLEEGVELAKKTGSARFDESIDAAINLGIDPRKANQMVRGTVGLPYGTGKAVRVVVFAEGEKADEAREAGADYVGLEDLASEVESGWTEFDRAVATPSAMRVVSRLGKILGPRGLMPNPKVGTVTEEIRDKVAEIKTGQVEFRADRGGVVHLPIGRRSFETEALMENFRMVVDALTKAKPAAAKGRYLERASLATTMGPGIKVALPSSRT